jgi:restriction system protein
VAIPTYEDLILPLLRYSSDNKEHSSKDPTDSLAKEFNLTEEEKNRLLPNGKRTVFYNRVGWALSYLKQAGLAKATRRGYYKITERGTKVIEQNPDKIDVQFLRQYQEFLEFENRSKNGTKPEPENRPDEETPEEKIEYAYNMIFEKLANELLQNIKNCTPAFFEHLVVELLVKMGYGGSIKEAGKAIGKTGDEGIDGIIKEDILGLDVIYIQAKRWNNTVGRPDIHKFAGALQGQRAKKGIFITTGKFSNDALEYIKNIDTKIVLIDGNKLSEYMIDNNIGVTDIKNYVLKSINYDYFEEEI